MIFLPSFTHTAHFLLDLFFLMRKTLCYWLQESERALVAVFKVVSAFLNSIDRIKFLPSVVYKDLLTRVESGSVVRDLWVNFEGIRDEFYRIFEWKYCWCCEWQAEGTYSTFFLRMFMNIDKKRIPLWSMGREMTSYRFTYKFLETNWWIKIEKLFLLSHKTYFLWIWEIERIFHLFLLFISMSNRRSFYCLRENFQHTAWISDYFPARKSPGMKIFINSNICI